MFANALPGIVRAIHRNTFRSGIVLGAVVLVWGAIVLAGMGALIHYENTPGAAARSPKQWPQQSGLVPSDSVATLVMFVHPHCPCTRASLGELEIIMARCQTRPRTHVVFLQPTQFEDGWAHSGLWKHARSIPEVTCHLDHNGREAQMFGALTSGQAVVYDANGRLRFQGGITSSRGHAGDNVGRASLMTVLQHQETQPPATKGFCVFGCPLFSDPEVSRKN